MTQTLLHNFWFIQGLGALALIFIFLAWNAAHRKNIFILQSINLILFFAHYILLSAYAGAAMCLVVLLRNFVFIKKGQAQWASHVAWLYVSMFISGMVLVIFWNGWPTVLPVFAVMLGTYAMWRDKPADMRYYMLIVNLIWIPYTLIIHSYPGLVAQMVGIVGILVGMYRLDRKE